MTARESVARRVAEQAAKFPDLTIAPLETEGLDSRDAALAHAIYDAVIRHWLTIGMVVGQFTRQPTRSVEPSLQGVLLSGAAQLLYFDRLPPHAVLNESVELAKRLVRPGAAGLVNAVLHRVLDLVRAREARPDDWAERRDQLPLGDGRVLQLAEEILPEDPLERLGMATSHPAGLIRRWSTLHPRERLKRLALHTLATPPTVLNTAHARQSLPETLQLHLQAHSIPGHHVFTGSRVELLSLLEAHPDVWVQDAASSRAIDAVKDLQPSLIVDACAGQGTKTRQLAAVFPGAKVIATDVDQQRFRTLLDVFRDSEQVEVTPPDELRRRVAASADLVLLDVPCSNTGVLARRPEARYRAGREQLARLSEIQRQILADAVPLLRQRQIADRPPAAIVYSTCSIEREENEFQADWASREFNLRMTGRELLLPGGLPGEDPALYHDGSFFAILSQAQGA